MSVLLGFYSPIEGVSVEETFKAHTSRITREGSVLPGLRRYIVGRVTKLDKWELVFTNYFHMAWDEETLMKKYLGAVKERKSLPEIDSPHQFKLDSICSVEEKLIFENRATADQKAAAIRFNVYSPREGISPKEMYQFHMDVHAPDIMETISRVATPGLKRYVVGWLAEVVIGKPLFTNYVKMWWDDLGAMNRYLEAIWTAKRPSDRKPEKEMGPRVIWQMNSLMDGDVICEER